MYFRSQRTLPSTELAYIHQLHRTVWTRAANKRSSANIKHSTECAACAKGACRLESGVMNPWRPRANQTPHPSPCGPIRILHACQRYLPLFLLATPLLSEVQWGLPTCASLTRGVFSKRTTCLKITRKPSDSFVLFFVFPAARRNVTLIVK